MFVWLPSHPSFIVLPRAALPVRFIFSLLFFLRHSSLFPPLPRFHPLLLLSHSSTSQFFTVCLFLCSRYQPSLVSIPHVIIPFFIVSSSFLLLSFPFWPYHLFTPFSVSYTRYQPLINLHLVFPHAHFHDSPFPHLSFIFLNIVVVDSLPSFSLPLFLLHLIVRSFTSFSLTFSLFLQQFVVFSFLLSHLSSLSIYHLIAQPFSASPMFSFLLLHLICPFFLP